MNINMGCWVKGGCGGGIRIRDRKGLVFQHFKVDTGRKNNRTENTNFPVDIVPSQPLHINQKAQPRNTHRLYLNSFAKNTA